MAETKVIKPYEILLRYSCEIGEKAGHLRGMHLQQMAFLVDNDGVITARLNRGRDDMPADFPPEELPKYLGGGFVALQQQLDDERSAAKAAADAAQATADATIAALTQERDAHAARIQQLGDAIAQAHAVVFPAADAKAKV